MDLGNKISKIRKDNNLTQEDFAEKLDVSRQAISRWENGTALPDAQNILQISKLFNVTADYLLNDDYKGETDISAVEESAEEAEVTLVAPETFIWPNCGNPKRNTTSAPVVIR